VTVGCNRSGIWGSERYDFRQAGLEFGFFLNAAEVGEGVGPAAFRLEVLDGVAGSFLTSNLLRGVVGVEGPKDLGLLSVFNGNLAGEPGSSDTVVCVCRLGAFDSTLEFCYGISVNMIGKVRYGPRSWPR
jgi:hypothetical protein